MTDVNELTVFDNEVVDDHSVSSWSWVSHETEFHNSMCEHDVGGVDVWRVTHTGVIGDGVDWVTWLDDETVTWSEIAVLWLEDDEVIGRRLESDGAEEVVVIVRVTGVGMSDDGTGDVSESVTDVVTGWSEMVSV